MYGTVDDDWVVRYYDEAFTSQGVADLPWIVGKVRQTGGPILDLACGAGRIALRLAQIGYEVTGLDRSGGMLSRFRDKLAREPAEVRARVRLAQAAMPAFALARQFKTIICCDAFFHNLSVADQLSCLGCVVRCLAPGGRFLFNLPNPTCEFILKSTGSERGTFTERGRYPLADGGLLRLEQALDGDIVEGDKNVFLPPPQASALHQLPAPKLRSGP